MAFSGAPALTKGAVSHIYTTKDNTTRPLLQIIDLRRITSANANNSCRYRVSVSDGEHFMQAMLATQLNSLVDDESIQVNTIVRMGEHICNEVANKRIIIIIGIETEAHAPDRIGDPQSCETLGDGATESAPLPKVDNPGAAPMGQAGVPTNSAPNGEGGFRPTPGRGSTWGAPSGDVKPSSSGIMSMANGRTPGSVTAYRPIQTINPYQNGWTIRGRCTYLADMRKYVNHRGEGQVISFELTDDSGSIRITAFGEKAQHVESTVKPNAVYTVSRATLKQANEKYNRSTSSFEMTLDRSSELQQADDDGSVAKIHYNFIKIANLESVEVKGSCDVVAAIHQIGELTEIVARSTGEAMKKRSLTLVDDSNASVELTLWRKQAETLVTEADESRHPIIVLRNASRGDYGGVCLNTSRATVIEIDPTSVPEGNALRGWYDAGGASSGNFQTLSNAPGSGSGGGSVYGDRKSLQEAEDEDVSPGLASGSATYVSRLYITMINKEKDLSYASDPDTKRKCTQESPGLWTSESTGRTLRDEDIVHRYICNLKVADYSGSQWMSAFDESASLILGKSAGEMRELKETDNALYRSIIDDAMFRPLVVKVSVREQTYQQETKVRHTISRCESVDFRRESRQLLSEIASYGISS